MSYESIKNYQEQVVQDLMAIHAPRFPRIARSEDLCADAACIALNSLKARYFRHAVDLHFYMTDEERAVSWAAANAAVEAALKYIDSRLYAELLETERGSRYG